jgi:3-keto-5-aminohexanoate cleavage enzyme
VSFTIEKAKLEDYDSILEVMKPSNMHHVPSPEMEELDVSCFFVAKADNRIVGAGGYKVLSQTQGKTTLLAVLPEYGRQGIGKALQDARLKKMHSLGVKTVTTNADRPETINWYKNKYGYKEVGTLQKVCDFGDSTVDQWTTLELSLDSLFANEWKKQYVADNEPHPLAPYPPLLINVCLTGMIPTKEQTPHVPVTPEEIIQDACEVAKYGAQIVHIHARDKDGKPTPDAKIYEHIIKEIRKREPDLICCVTTSGRNWSEFEQRSEVLQLTGDSKPDFASLTLGSLNFPSGPSVNSPKMIEQLATTMAEKNIRPELEVFDVGMVGFAKYLERKGVIRGRKYFNILLGSLGQGPATIGTLSNIVSALPPNSVWAGAGIGMFQLPVNVMSIVAGGGVRVGLEDSIHYDFNRQVLASNVGSVYRIVEISIKCGRNIASKQEARQMMGLDD